MPVKIIVKPCLSAASIDSWSRTDPPGWMIALIPPLADFFHVICKGKKAFKASTAIYQDGL